MYRCAECGVAVIVVPGHEPIRACDHDSAAIIGEMTALLEGSGEVRG